MPDLGRVHRLFLETAGIEFEGTHLTQRDVARIISELGFSNYFHVTRDASTEAPATQLRGTRTQLYRPRNAEGALDNISSFFTNGFELVSEALNEYQIKETIPPLLEALSDAGNKISDRCATHYHVGFAYNLDYMKKSVALGLAVDPLLFAIAGYGKVFRGQSNHAIYCRPLELGVAVPLGDRVYLLNPIDALITSTVDEFWLRYFLSGRNSRYHPARYFATNLWSVSIHGTLEFRHFNQTNNSRFVMATVELVKALTKLITLAPIQVISELQTVSVLRMSTDKILRLFANLLETFEDYGINLSESTKNTIDWLINNTPLPEFSSVIPLTHVSNTREIVRIQSWMQLLSPRQYEVSGHIDIHNIQIENILDL